MNLYRTGLNAVVETGLPVHAEPLRNYAGEIVAGVRLVRTGEARIFKLGAAPALQKQGSGLAKGVGDVVRWLADLVVAMLVLAGVLVLGSALARGIR